MANSLDTLKQLMSLKQMQDSAQMQRERFAADQAYKKKSLANSQRNYDLSNLVQQRLKADRDIKAQETADKNQFNEIYNANIPHLINAYKNDRSGFINELTAFSEYKGAGKDTIKKALADYDSVNGKIGNDRFKDLQYTSISPEVGYILSEYVNKTGRTPESPKEFSDAVVAAYSDNKNGPWKQRREDYSSSRTAGRFTYPSRSPEGDPQLMNTKTGEFHTGHLPGGGAIEKTDKPLPIGNQETINQGINALDMLDVMEGSVEDVTTDSPIWNRVSGYGKKVGLWAGISSDKTEAFAAAKDQFRLFAQGMIKGTPSNFDVETIIATLPDFTTKTSFAKKKIATSKNLFKRELEHQISYYLGTDKKIPPLIVESAKRLGVSFENIVPSENPWGTDKKDVSNMSVEDLLKEL